MLATSCSISISKSNTKDSHDKVCFQVLEPQKFSALSQVILHHTWSPHIWRDGRRAGKNWQKANFIALDFDSGFPLQETITICQTEGLTFLIGTTKSHQVEKISPSGKVSPPLDRYRLLIATEGSCNDAETYRNTLDYFAMFMPIDESCKDLARYFFPCKEIVAFGGSQLQPWLVVDDQERARRKKLYEEYEERLRENRGSGIVPSWILHELKAEHMIGTRHKLCYRIGAELSKLGFEESYIEQLVMSSSLNAIGGEDVRRAVRNGIDGAKRYWRKENNI